MLLVATLTLPATVWWSPWGSPASYSACPALARHAGAPGGTPGAAGRVFGIVSTGFNIGGIIGPILFGWMMDHGSPRWVFGASIFMAMVALFGLVEERRVERARAAMAGS